jgi:hypothetical protein
MWQRSCPRRQVRPGCWKAEDETISAPTRSAPDAYPGGRHRGIVEILRVGHPVAVAVAVGGVPRPGAERNCIGPIARA